MNPSVHSERWSGLTPSRGLTAEGRFPNRPLFISKFLNGSFCRVFGGWETAAPFGCSLVPRWEMGGLASEMVGGGRSSPDLAATKVGPYKARTRSFSTSARSDRAFTLVEVLVALVIFAMAAVVLGSSYLNVLISYETVSRGVQVNEDFAFARELVLREPDRKKLEQGGEFETVNGRRANWSVEITSTTVPNVFNVAFTCEISDPTRTEPQKVTQQFTVLRPTWVIDTAERDQLKADIKTRIYELQGKKA
jgi:general secretion pathway protein I